VKRKLTPAQLAAARTRGARYRARRQGSRGNKHTRWDGRYGYDGVVLGMLVLRGLISEAETADPQKVNAATTKFLFYEAYKAAPERIPSCVLRPAPKN
jgi:hypothetical protein